jgi:hypothetical protein
MEVFCPIEQVWHDNKVTDSAGLGNSACLDTVNKNEECHLLSVFATTYYDAFGVEPSSSEGELLWSAIADSLSHFDRTARPRPRQRQPYFFNKQT